MRTNRGEHLRDDNPDDDQLALAKEGYKYLIGIFYQALKAAGRIREDQLVEFIQQKAGSGNKKRLEDESRF